MKRIICVLLPLGAAILATPAAAQDWSTTEVGDSLPAPARTFGPPAPPQGAAPNQTIPALDAEGHYLTPNLHLSAEATSWHVRAALNVAALGCRDAAESETVAAYNGLIVRQRDPLAAADAGVKAQYRARYGAGWAAQHDREMTKVYNFFAQPPAQQRFCAAAREVLAEAAMVEPAQFTEFAAAALPRLEAPFTDFYRDYDAYRAAQAAWSNREQGPALAYASLPARP